MSKGQGNLIIVTLILVTTCIACDGFSRISGHVYDSNGRPISGALVVFESVEKGQPIESYQNFCQTNENGRFALGFTDSPFDHKLRLSIKKDGFKPYSLEMWYSETRKMMEDNHELSVILEGEQ